MINEAPALSAYELHRLGRAAYGTEWQTPFSKESGTALRTIQRWAADGISKQATAIGVRRQLEARARVAIPTVVARRPEERERAAYAGVAPHVDALVQAGCRAGYAQPEIVAAMQARLSDLSRHGDTRSYREGGTSTTITRAQAEALACVASVLRPEAADQAQRLLLACEGPRERMEPFDIESLTYRDVTYIPTMETVCGGLPAALIEDLRPGGPLSRPSSVIALMVAGAGWGETDDETLARILAGGPLVDDLLATVRGDIATAQSIRFDLDEPEGD